MNNNHGYSSIEEYLTDVHKAIPISKISNNRDYNYCHLNWEPPNPNTLLIAWKLHYTYENQFQIHPRSKVITSVIGEWFTKEVPYTSKYQYNPGEVHYKELTKYPTKYRDVKQWGIFTNEALPYIRFNKEYLNMCIEIQRNPHNEPGIPPRRRRNIQQEKLYKLWKLNGPKFGFWKLEIENK